MKKIYAAFILMLFSFAASAQFPAPYCAEDFPESVEPITNVTIAGINNTSPATIGGDALQDFTAITGAVLQGGSYLIQVQGNTDGNYATYVSLFADWNHDNDFLDAGESYNIGAIVNSTGADGKVASTTIVVPGSALTGATRIRISKKYSSTVTYPSPCNTAGFGQAEDYTLTVSAGNACTGTPSGGAVTPAATSICSNRSVTLTSTAINTGTGISYQWQSSPSGANTFTNITGAVASTLTTPVSAPTDFRVRITCTATSLVGTSTTATVTTTASPTNDSVCSAIPLTLNGPSNCGNTSCATGYGSITAGVPGNPAFANSTPNNTVWYTFTPTTTGVVEFKFKRPAGVTTGLLNGWLGIYTVTGTCPFTFTEVPSSIVYDLTTSDSVLVGSPSLTAGTTYYLMVDGFSGSFGSFCIQVNTAPAIPLCTTLLSPANASTNVDNAFTLRWRKVTGATSYDVYIDGATPPSFYGSVADTFLTLSSVAPNTTFYWSVVPTNSGGDAVGCNTNVFSFTTRTTAVNDDCATAVALTPGSTIFGTTVGSTQTQAPSLCSGATSDKAYDVWYSIRALSNGSFTVALAGDASFDGVLGIYRGTCGALILDTCRDVTFAGGTESITVTNAVAGTNYLIRVYSYYDVSDSVSSFIINASGAALPVTGLTLSGVRNGSKAQLSWRTLTEVNNAGFELQRSADGSYFTGIAQVASKANSGNSSAAITYNVDDVKPLSGANYYRLKQTDKDGKSSYSNIVFLKGVAVNNLSLSALYPNPTRDVLKAAIQAPAAESITFMVTDMMGKVVSRQVSNVINGDNIININVASLPSGSYLLKAVCRNGCESAYRKFTKQ